LPGGEQGFFVSTTGFRQAQEQQQTIPDGVCRIFARAGAVRREFKKSYPRLVHTF
jgi:hypothetical protein